MRGAKKRIIEELTSWPGIRTEPGRFGATAFVLERHNKVVGQSTRADAMADMACESPPS